MPRLFLALMILLLAGLRAGIAGETSRDHEGRALHHRRYLLTSCPPAPAVRLVAAVQSGGESARLQTPRDSGSAVQSERSSRGQRRATPRRARRRRDPSSPIRLFAAASTLDVVEGLTARFEAETGFNVDLFTQSSGALAQQIMRGGEADLFFSASQEWADRVSVPNLRGTSRVSRRVPLLTNRMVVVVPVGSTLKITALNGLLDPAIERVAIANPDSAPAGRYAKEVLQREQLWDQLQDKLIAGQDVRATLMHVAEGGAQAGIVYQTEAAISKQVRVAVPIDESLHTPIRYPLLLLRRGEGHPGAPLLFEYLSGPAMVYKQYGFDVAPAGQQAADWGATGPGEQRRGAGFFTQAEIAAVKLSCLVGFGVVAVSLPLAVFLGYLLARPAFPGKSLVEVIVNLPLVLPPVVTGYLLLLTFNAEALLGNLLRRHLGINVAYDWKGLVVAAAVMSFPLMVRAIRLGFQSVDVRLETAARTLGAGRLSSFFTVSLPLARRGIIAGCVLAFARSLGEFGATVMLVGQQENTRTIPLLIYAMRNRIGGLEEIWRVLLISLFLAGAALAASEYLERRGLRSESA